MSIVTEQELDRIPQLPNGHKNVICVIFVRNQRARGYKQLGAHMFSRELADSHVVKMTENAERDGDPPRTFRVLNLDKTTDAPYTIGL